MATFKEFEAKLAAGDYGLAGARRAASNTRSFSDKEAAAAHKAINEYFNEPPMGDKTAKAKVAKPAKVAKGKEPKVKTPKVAKVLIPKAKAAKAPKETKRRAKRDSGAPEMIRTAYEANLLVCANAEIVHVLESFNALNIDTAALKNEAQGIMTTLVGALKYMKLMVPAATEETPAVPVTAPIPATAPAGGNGVSNGQAAQIFGATLARGTSLPMPAPMMGSK